jgi:hypothetical protein
MDSLVAGERFGGLTVKDWTKKITGYNLSNDYISGMAYAANTAALRTDFPESRIKTFWVDALEYSTMAANNQYFKAAKYGGFTDKDGDGVPDAGGVGCAWAGLQGHCTAGYLLSGIRSRSPLVRLEFSFQSDQLLDCLGKRCGCDGVGDFRQPGCGWLLQTTYNSLYWSGDLKGLKIDSIDVDTGDINTSQVWSAATNSIRW